MGPQHHQRPERMSRERLLLTGQLTSSQSNPSATGLKWPRGNPDSHQHSHPKTGHRRVSIEIQHFKATPAPSLHPLNTMRWSQRSSSQLAGEPE